MSEPLFGQRQKQSLAILALIVIGILFLGRGDDAPAEEQVRQAVEAMVKGAEDKKLRPFQDHLHQDYRDKDRRDKQGMINFMRGIFLRHRNVSLSILSLEIQQKDQDEILADLQLFVGESVLPEDKASFRLTFRPEGSSWKLYRADWTAASESSW